MCSYQDFTYHIPADDIASGIRTAFDIYVSAGIEPKSITDEKTSVLFDPRDAYRLVCEAIGMEKYIEKHRIN